MIFFRNTGLKMSADNTYTLNKLQLFEDCPQKYKLFYLDKIYIPEPTFNTKAGNNLHRLINYYLTNQDVSKLITLLTPREKQLWDNFMLSKFSSCNCLESEYSFNVKIFKYWLVGRIDALYEDKGKYCILDWKTGANFTLETSKFQTAFYLICLYEILKAKACITSPQDLSMCYFELSTNKTHVIRFDDNLYKECKDNILDVIESINGCTQFSLNVSDRCKMCKYRLLCDIH